jgi:thioredoxin reductase
MDTKPDNRFRAIIVGADPVGLVAGHTLAASGIIYHAGASFKHQPRNWPWPGVITSYFALLSPDQVH